MNVARACVRRDSDLRNPFRCRSNPFRARARCARARALRPRAAHLRARGRLVRQGAQPDAARAPPPRCADNFRHAFMVTHTSWLFLCDSALRKKQLQELDWLALLLSAICHDLGHPGTTNAYQVNTGSALALRYNDASVLENHHCCVGFATLERAGILKCLDAAEVKALRKLIVAAILATDMSVHKDLLARVSARSAAADAGADGGKPGGAGGAPESAGGFSRDSPDDRQLLVSFLLHCADLCNPLFPPAMSRRIADELAVEFSRQAELERAAGLPVTVMVAGDDTAKAKLELGFIDYGALRSTERARHAWSAHAAAAALTRHHPVRAVVRPLYVTLAVLAPGFGPHCLALIDKNRAMWNEVIVTSDSDAASKRSNG
jgi:hypothetical protein